MGYDFNDTLLSRDVSDFLIEINSSISETDSDSATYAVHLIDKHGRKTTVGDDFRGKSHAVEVRQSMIDALGPEWEASVLTESDDELPEFLKLIPSPLVKWEGFLHPLKFIAPLTLPLAVVFDLLSYLGRI